MSPVPTDRVAPCHGFISSRFGDFVDTSEVAYKYYHPLQTGTRMQYLDWWVILEMVEV